MANPYYIPAGPSVGERVAQPLTELMKIRQVGELGTEHNRLMGEDIALRGRGQDIEAQKLTETQRHNKATELVGKQNFDANAAKILGMAVDKMDPKGALKWLKQDWEMMAENPEVDKGYVYGYYKQNWPSYKEKIVESFRELATNVSMDNKLTKYQQEQFQKKYNDMADQVSKDEKGATLDMFFPTVAREYQMENLKIASQFPAQSGYKPMTREEWMADETIKAGLRPKGLNIEFDDTGKPVRITQGDVASTPNMQKPTANKVEEGLFNVQNNLARLDEIQQSYKPEFLELGTIWGAFKTAWGEKLKGTKLGEMANALVGTDMDPADKQLLSDYSAFKRDAINNINLYIKEVTGAQMSEKEADRIRKGMPDPGEGLFDGDSPTEFESKWKSASKSLRASQARYIMYLKQGLSPELVKTMVKNGTAMSLMEVNNKINEKAREFEKTGMTPDMIRKELKRLFFTMEQ